MFVHGADLHLSMNRIRTRFQIHQTQQVKLCFCQKIMNYAEILISRKRTLKC